MDDKEAFWLKLVFRLLMDICESSMKNRMLPIVLVKLAVQTCQHTSRKR